LPLKGPPFAVIYQAGRLGQPGTGNPPALSGIEQGKCPVLLKEKYYSALSRLKKRAYLGGALVRLARFARPVLPDPLPPDRQVRRQRRCVTAWGLRRFVD